MVLCCLCCCQPYLCLIIVFNCLFYCRYCLNHIPCCTKCLQSYYFFFTYTIPPPAFFEKCAQIANKPPFSAFALCINPMQKNKSRLNRRFTSLSPLSVFTFPFPPFPRKNRPNWHFFLHISQIFCTFVPESYAGGKYVLRKAFRKGSFLGRFLTY